ncbi:MAG: Ig-like domain-containing protein [Planctomycetes bacterium]|nr:Ig-like domain-containing protein [Planctomycetota bacterium]
MVLARNQASFAQLDESWTVTVNGQTVQVEPDGSFRIPNVAAPDLFGPDGPGSARDFLSDDFIRVVATSTFNGITRYAFGECFQIRQGETFTVEDLTVKDFPPVPVSLSIAPDTPTLTAIGETTQIRVTGTLLDGTTQDLTQRNSCTIYRTSNPAIATVAADGLVTAVSAGPVFIVATNGGATAVARLQVAPGDPLTTLEGFVQFEDGIPAQGATVEIDLSPEIRMTDASGHFSFSGIPSLLSPVVLSATLQVGADAFLGTTGSIALVPGGLTDAGVISLIGQDAGAGPMILSGMSPEQAGSAGQELIRDVLSFVVVESTLHPMPGRIAMLGGNNTIANTVRSIAEELGYQLDHYRGTFVALVNLDPDTSIYDAIYMPTSSANLSGGLTSFEMLFLNEQTSHLARFVNAGGGLAAFSQNVSGGYGWITLEGLPTEDVSDSFGSSLTAQGMTLFSSSAEALNYHTQFLGPEGFYGMSVLARALSGTPVIIGGLATLPRDCNRNDIEDASELADGVSPDCNRNGIPDACDLQFHRSGDCNNTAIPDECEIDRSGTSPAGDQFCVENCVPDCNGNGILDTCEADCNSNGIPDECDIDRNSSASGGPYFCIEACDPDCNDNGIPDACEDCNGNGIADACDVATGTSIDCDEDAVLDDCEIGGTLVGPNLNFLTRLDAASGRASAISGLGLRGFANVTGMAFDPINNILYAADGVGGTRQLIKVDGFTGFAETIGPIGIDRIEALAFDPNTVTLYAIEDGGDVDRLLQVNRITGVGTVIGSLGFGGVEGLAFDTNTNILFGVNRTFLISINPVTGAGTAVGPHGASVEDGLAFDANTSTLLATGGTNLLTIDTATGRASVVGVTGFQAQEALAFDPNSDTLYAADEITDQLVTLSTSTGEASAIGSFGFGIVHGLAFDFTTNTLFGTNLALFGGSDILIRVDLITGQGTAVGQLGMNKVGGLAFDPNGGMLYGANHGSSISTISELVVIDTETGAANLIGSIGFGNVFGLAFDHLAGTLYGVNGSELIAIDPSSGIGTLVGPIGFSRVEALAFDPSRAVLYGTQTSLSGSHLIRIDSATGVGTSIGILPDFFSVEGLAYIPNTDTLVGAEELSDQLFALDVTTASVSSIGALGFTNMEAVAFDRNTRRLYGLDRNSRQLVLIDAAHGILRTLGRVDERVEGLAFDPNANVLYGATRDSLYSIDTTTADSTLVGSIGFSSIRGLAFDSTTDMLYGSEIASDQLIEIDTNTGIGSPIGPLGFDLVFGLAFDARSDTLFGTDRKTNQLLTIDRSTGAGTARGSTQYTFIGGLAFLDGDCNATGIPDECDVADGISEDCNANSTPDECEPDCQPNGMADECDIRDNISTDCNRNGTPDECEPSVDCNNNGAFDACDILNGLSADCNENRVPDECESPNPNTVGGCCDEATGVCTVETEPNCIGGGLIYLGNCISCLSGGCDAGD